MIDQREEIMGKKLDELIVFIAEQSEKDPKFGATKLNKILFAADFHAFAYRGESVSGATYVHRNNGPVPREIVESKDRLIKEEKIVEDIVEYWGYPQKRILPKVEPDLSIFSKEEISIVKEWIDKFKNYNATELSEWTHKLVPWLITKDEEVIPYSAVFVLLDLPVEADGIDWAENELSDLSTMA